MPDKPSKADLNIYLAKSEVQNSADIIKSLSDLKEIPLNVSGISPCTLYIKKNFSKSPRWANFFAPVVPTKEFGFNSSTGAVLYAKVGKEIFILTFGQGHHMVDSEKTEMNFGLMASLNLLDTKNIRSIDKSSFEQHPTQTREQTGLATELQYFGVNIENDLLRAITGKPKDEIFGKRISGKDASKLSVEIELKGLPDLLKSLKKAFKDTSYKKGPFAWIDHIGEVKEKALHNFLDDKIIERVNSGNFDRVWLSVPEIIDWDQVVGFKYSHSASAPRYFDIRLSDFVKPFNGMNLNIQNLKNRRILCVDSSDFPVYEKSVYRFVYAEVNYQSNQYVLNNGKWYKISSSFAEQVNKFFAQVPPYKKSLPEFNDNTEGDYNERVAKNDSKSFVLMDNNLIKVPEAASPVEPCDLFRNGNEFIHVKRYGGSSVLSHLFNQGLVSGELFQMDPEFRKILNSKLPSKFKLKDPKGTPKTKDYHVVFAIISESDDKDLSIPFFSKISLRHVFNRLKAIGFDVTVAKISVEEMKKKTIKCPSK